MKLAIWFFSAMAAAAPAKETPKSSPASDQHAHRSHGAHVHGHAEVAIAFDGPRGRLEFKTPAEAIIGFEHEARTEAQKKAVTEAGGTFAAKIADMVKWEAGLKCRYEAPSTRIQREKEETSHSEFVASVEILCEKSPAGSRVVFDFQSVFPKLRDVDVTFLVDNLQKSAEVRSSGVTVELK